MAGNDGAPTLFEARAPGRVNLIGDHTDTTGGWVLPFAIDRWTTVRGRRGGDAVRLRSEGFPGEAVLGAGGDPEAAADTASGWTRYVVAVVAELRAAGRAVPGFTGTVSSTVPAGGGLSSSAALEVAVAMALGATDPSDPVGPLAPQDLARLCRRAEHRATGTPTGIMDQLVCVSGRAGHAVLIDCTTLHTTPVPLPSTEVAEVVVVPSGVHHELATSAYAERVAECGRAEAEIGPLRDARPTDVAAIADPVVRARARHVVGENARVHAMVEALAAGDLAGAGVLMAASHVSLRDDYAVSVPEVDTLVEALSARPGVFGARMTGGGFGGSVVALCRPGALADLGERAWVVRAVDGASAGAVAPPTA
jgi:galactokinase